MKKPTLLIIIDNLSKGGAEVLLVGILSELAERYTIVLVTLTSKCDFPDEEIFYQKKYLLDFKNKLSIPTCVMQLKKIIKNDKPSLIHSHLFYSSLIARLSCPRDIPLFYSLHNEMSKCVFNNSRILTFLEKNTIRKNHSVIAVSQTVLSDYEKTIKKIEHSYVLRNFISDKYYRNPKSVNDFNEINQIRLVAVGNIKKQKNYTYLIIAFESLKKYPVSLDIYGRGEQKDLDDLQQEIHERQLSISLKGSCSDLHNILGDYDLFVSSSLYEGFGISVIEAMASGLPVLLSDLPVFHEITRENALFFDINIPSSFVELIIEIFNKKFDLKKLSEQSIIFSKNYKKEAYLKKLSEIYEFTGHKEINDQFVNNQYLFHDCHAK